MAICFVIMGFGRKTDFRQAKEFDLDKTYRCIIKPAILRAGLTCVRADEELGAGVIDVPMFERLLAADVVIADLSTSNLNAMYELGVRHALRPRTTIVIAEDGFLIPFDTNHLRVRKFKHLGESIDVEEALQMQEGLQKAIESAIAGTQADSPVYTFLHALQPPMLAAVDLVRTKGNAETADGESYASMMEKVRAAKEKGDFASAGVVLRQVLAAQGDRPDHYVLQQLALATYKSKQPSPKQALLDACAVMQPLDPERSNDPETLGLWGAIHKRLAELPAGDSTDAERAGALDTAIRSYQKGFILRDDYYNGINFAFLLDRRAADATGDERVADHVTARRVRQVVVRRCRALLEKGFSSLQDPAMEADERFWVRASLVEALVGTSAPDAEETLQALINDGAPQAWMIGSLQEQLSTLRRLMDDANRS